MIVIGSDHAGVELCNLIIKYLQENNIEVENVSKNVEANDDYPDVAVKVCNKVLDNSCNLGIAICGTGIGVSIACNKVKNIRAALCTDVYTAQKSREHNNANIMCLGARTSSCSNFSNVKDMIDAFLNTEYEGMRHEKRLQKIKMIEDGLDLEGEK